MKKTLEIVLKLFVFILSLYLVVEGQKHIGFPGLITMLVGLAGLLGLLFSYNKAHQ